MNSLSITDVAKGKLIPDLLRDLFISIQKLDVAYPVSRIMLEQLPDTDPPQYIFRVFFKNDGNTEHRFDIPLSSEIRLLTQINSEPLIRSLMLLVADVRTVLIQFASPTISPLLIDINFDEFRVNVEPLDILNFPQEIFSVNKTPFS